MDLFAKIEENRNEKIAIPFFGWLKNPVEMMIDYILRGEKLYYWVRRYGIIKELVSCGDRYRLWAQGSMYTVKSFIGKMLETADPNIDKRDVEKDFTELIGSVDPSTSMLTMPEVLLTRLISEEFVRGIYIYAPWFSDNVKNYLMRFFRESSKIYLVETDLKGMINREEKMTTIFVEDVDELMGIIQSYPENTEVFKGIQFNISANPSLQPDVKELVSATNSNLGRLKDKKEIFMYEEYMKTLFRRLGCNASFMQVKCVTNTKVEPDENENKEV